MNAWAVAGAVALFLVVDLVVVGAVLTMAFAPLRTLAGRFPPQPIAPDARRRSFQSLHVGLAKLGGCMHIAADRAYLHLEPAWMARRFGIRPMSIPWPQITVQDPRRAMVRARVAETDVYFPRWVLDQPGAAP